MSLSTTLYQQAQCYMPGGVNSPVRAFNGVGGQPVLFRKGEGAYLLDVDNKHYIDYVNSWGALILGHAHPAVVDAVCKAAKAGLSFGATTETEILLAQKIIELMPNVEMLRMVNSGTEATMTALRLARGITHHDKIIKFEGCYHGHSDSLLVKAGSGALTLGIPNSPGVTANTAADTLTAEYNNIDSVTALFEQHPDDIAAIIIEPIAGNMGLVQASPHFLSQLRQLCDRYGSLLIFDEVMTGFRVALGGAQALYNIKPDLTTLGKVIGGGLPVGAIGGSKKFMEYLAPLGPVYQAGTLSGNPIAMAAGLATLELIGTTDFFEALNKKIQKLMCGIQEVATANDVKLVTDYVGAMFGMFFTEDESVTNFQQVCACNQDTFKRFFHGMLAKGIYFAPSAFEAGFITNAHGDEEIELTISAANAVFETFKQ